MAHERGGPATRAGALVAGLLAGPLGDDLGEAQRAARAWYAANGDRERAHTTGVWLRKPPRAGADPVMVVRVDSGLLASELGTNKDLYLSAPRLMGVESLADSGVNLRIAVDVKEENIFPARRRLNRDVRVLFQEKNVEIPFPQLVVHKADD